MTEPEMTTVRRDDIYWACEAIRAWAEGDRLRGNRYLKYAFHEVQRWQDQNSTD